MRLFTSLTFLLLIFITSISAEGTRELAPNGSITVAGNTTTDLAALHINNPAFNNFASYTNSDPHSRLYLHVKDPSTECVFVGFSFGHLNVTSPNPTRINFEYRIKDPNGNVVFGPVTINTTGGNIQNWSEAFTGPMQIAGAGGYNAHNATSADLTSQGWTGPGDYYIEFLAAGDGSDLLIDFWDITVADCTLGTPLAKKGRVWSYNWSIFAVNDFGFPNRPFNGAFYVCAPDPADDTKAFITKIDFNGSGFRPAAFNIAFNSFGSMNTGNITEDRKSVELTNSTQSEYAIFLNDPVELCETAIVGEITLIGISRCDDGLYCIKFTASKEGQIELLLDFDGQDNIYTPGSSDVLITHAITADQVGVPSCILWDGLDGFGNPLPQIAGTQIPIIISYAQGIYHFPIYDAELMISGFSLQAVRPASSIPLLYYDDSNISVASGSGEPAVQLTGCTVPCHRWTQFIDNSVPGFGNLHTINSWWFSQRIVKQDVLLLPGYYTCEVDGPQRICHGSTTQVIVAPQVNPFAAEAPEIISTIWTGPGIIGSNLGTTITVDAAGSYSVEIVWVTGTGDTCSTSCDYQLSIDPPLEETIDTLIVSGTVIDINGELISEAGQYTQVLTNSLGCDSILTINVKVIQTVLYYDLNACNANMDYGTQMDYSEFTFTQPDPLSCAGISATIVERVPPQMQKHSCTPGVNGSVAMCISSVDDCDYDPGNDATLAFEVTITPDPDTAVHLTGFSFFEKAPLEYVWINGPTGPNNYPTLFGLRILKNGVEIYKREDIPTTNDWSEHIYDFLNESEFIIEEASTFRFELLPYCLIGNGAEVAAWDIDEIYVNASCAPFEGQMQIISGVVKTPSGKLVSGVDVSLDASLHITDHRNAFTDAEGHYQFADVLEGSECKLTAYNNKDHKNGVSTLDLVLIQKHLLGNRPFESPYSFIAADANKSNTVSVKDLIELRKLILGYIAALPRNTSWRFGNASEQNGEQYPWGFKETIDIEELRYDYYAADFTAVKIGDINGDVTLNASGLLIEKRNNPAFELLFHDQVITEGQSFTLEVKAADDFSLSGMQFALDLKGLRIKSVHGNNIKITNEHFVLDDSELKVSWSEPVAIEGKQGDILFTLHLVAQKSGLLSDLVSLNATTLQPEAYVNEDLDVMPIQFTSQRNSLTQSTKLYQNEPNPFSESTHIKFDLEKSGNVQMTFFDISGRVIHSINNEYVKGQHIVEISSDEIGVVKGLIICQLESEGYLEVIKLVRL